MHTYKINDQVKLNAIHEAIAKSVAEAPTISLDDMMREYGWRARLQKKLKLFFSKLCSNLRKLF